MDKFEELESFINYLPRNQNDDFENNVNNKLVKVMFSKNDRTKYK